MENLREIALAHYLAGSNNVRALAKEFFDALDSDGDGKVDYNEFLVFMRQEGYQRMRGRYVFRELDSDGNGNLDFEEVMTLYYIIKSGRPCCDVCGELIAQVFFTCVACYESPQGTFDLCLNCYRSGTCDHNHDGRSQFLDSYTMLYSMRDSAMAARSANQNRPTPTQASTPRPSSSNAIVPAARRSGMYTALKTFEIALSIGNIGTSLCSIL